MRGSKLLDIVSVNPKKLFLIDALGALLSAFLLAVVLVKFTNLIGISPSLLYMLALFPIIFAIYDVFCYLKVTTNIGLLLKIIAYSNILYCGISLAVIISNCNQITYLGWIYFLGEILIILTLSNFEIKVGNKLKSEYQL